MSPARRGPTRSRGPSLVGHGCRTAAARTLRPSVYVRRPVRIDTAAAGRCARRRGGRRRRADGGARPARTQLARAGRNEPALLDRARAAGERGTSARAVARRGRRRRRGGRGRDGSSPRRSSTRTTSSSAGARSRASSRRPPRAASCSASASTSRRRRSSCPPQPAATSLALEGAAVDRADAARNGPRAARGALRRLGHRRGYVSGADSLPATSRATTRSVRTVTPFASAKTPGVLLASDLPAVDRGDHRDALVDAEPQRADRDERDRRRHAVDDERKRLHDRADRQLRRDSRRRARSRRPRSGP